MEGHLNVKFESQKIWRKRFIYVILFPYNEELHKMT